MILVGEAAGRAAADEAAGGQAHAMAAAEHGVLDQRHVGHGTMAVALLGHAAQARGARRPPAPIRPTGRSSIRTISALATRRSPESAWNSSFWPLPATPAMPKISPRRTSNEMSLSVVPNGPSAGRSRLRTTRRGAPPPSPARRESVRTSAPIISCAMLLAVSALGSQVATTLPPRRIVAAIAERFDLVELVADVEDRDALRRRAGGASRTAARPPAG